MAVILVGVLFVLGCHATSTGSAGAGGQCRVNSDCGGGKLCTSGVCVAAAAIGEGGACVATRDCAAGLYCGGAGVCAKGGSGAVGDGCTTDGQCLPPLRCALEGFTGTCATSGSGEVGAACQTHDACLSGLWCARDQTCQPIATAFPPFTGAACADEGAFRAYFEVPRPARPPGDFFRLPFPNDVRVSGGRLAISDFPTPGLGPLGVDFVRLYVDAWTTDFDGFSPIAPVTFRFSAPIDFPTATSDGVLFIDLTPGDTLGALLARNWSFNSTRGKYICANRFVVRNAIDSPLQARHTYAVILTTAIRSTTGAAAVADADLALLLAATQPTTDAALAAAWVTYQPLRDWLASRGTSAPAVAAAAVFTVADAAGHAQRLAAAAAAQPAPVLSALTLCGAGITSPCDDTNRSDGGADAAPSPSVRACVPADPKFYELHGKLSIPIFQQGTPPYEKPADGGGVLETAGVPQVARTEQVCFALAIPKGVSAPAAGWPLVVYHHDTGGSMRSIVSDGIAAALAGGTPATAVLGFDAVEHGARRGASTTSPEQLIFNLLNPRAARDNYLQGAVDVVQALRVAGATVGAAASPTGAAIAFNPAAVAFFGRTQGSTSGELALPFTDAAGAAVLSGAGAFMTASLLDRRSPFDLSAGLAFAAGETLDPLHPVMTLLQSFFDRIDPLDTNPMTLNKPATGRASKHLFMTWGVGDSYTPSSTMQPNAVTLHIPAIRPLIEAADLLLVSRPVSLNIAAGDGKMRTGVLAQYMPAGGAGVDAGVAGDAGGAGGGDDGNFVALKDPAAIADWSAFLRSYFATGTPAIP
jgi:hypothetical protein